jgi:hypothetical protein
VTGVPGAGALLADGLVALPEAVAQVEEVTRAAGGERLLLVRLAGGLAFDVRPDRGLDLGQLRVAGVPLAWTSAAGFPAALPDADGRGWLRAFGGGLLTTCGLLSYGAPSTDGADAHPLHGRYSSLRAHVTRAEVTADAVVVEGVTTEVEVFGAHLELRRRITSPLGSRLVRVEDVLVNRGVEPVEPMVLYHLNLGWPLVDDGTELTVPSTAVEPRDAEAAKGVATWSRFPAPSREYPEQVFRHELPADERLHVTVASARGLSVRIGFDTAELGSLFQWRVARDGGPVVLGVEPATAATILGRADARARGLLRPLAPGARLALGVEVEVTALP